MAWGMLLSSAYGAYNIAQAGKESRSLSNKNADLIYAENTEKIRKTKLSQAQTTSEAISLYGASGISMKSESIITYMDELKANFKKDIDWMEKARASNVEIERQRGIDSERTANRKAIGTILGGISSSADGK